MALTQRQRLLYEDRADVWKPTRPKDATTGVVGDQTWEKVYSSIRCYFELNPSQDDNYAFGREERDIILTLDIFHCETSVVIDSDYVVKNLTVDARGVNSPNYGRYWVMRGQARTFVTRRRRRINVRELFCSAMDNPPPGVS